MTSRSSRRAFFGELLRSAAKTADTVRGAIEETAADLRGSEWEEPRPVRARPASKLASAVELAALCADVGLAGQLGAVRRLALPSARLTHDGDTPEEAGRSYLAASETGREPSLLAQISLEEVAAVLGPTPLPTRGWLLVHRDRATVVDREAAPSPPNRAVSLSGELVLPRAWSSQVEPLELSPAEQVAWEELRKRLAALQGTEVDEYAETPSSVHRLFGYPDDVLSEAGPSQWRLLLQLTSDDELGLSFGDARARLYLWIRGSDLASVRAIKR